MKKIVVIEKSRENTCHTLSGDLLTISVVENVWINKTFLISNKEVWKRSMHEEEEVRIGLRKKLRESDISVMMCNTNGTEKLRELAVINRRLRIVFRHHRIIRDRQNSIVGILMLSLKKSREMRLGDMDISQGDDGCS